MPTRTLYRNWCQTCNEFELHTYKHESKDYRCLTCDTPHASTLLKDIPQEKLIAQRERYNQSQSQKLTKMFSGGDNFMNYGIFGLLANEHVRTEIVEADAGQEFINKRNRALQDEKLRLYHEQKAKEKEIKIQYKNLQRNQICLCGSGKKYKKCCLPKYAAIV